MPAKHKHNPLEDFDFMAEPVEEKPSLDQPDDTSIGESPSLTTNKDLVQSVLNVFDKLGREDWLLSQAMIDPKGYMNMLAKLIPKSIDAEDLQGLSIMIVDQYLEGDKVINVNTNTDTTRSPALPASAALAVTGGGPSELGQPASKFQGAETATGGNPNNPEVEIIDVFEED